VRGHVSALERKGYIVREPERARGIRVLHAPSPLSRLKKRLHELARTDQGVLHSVTYGLAWGTAGRADALRGPAVGQLRDAFEREAAEHGWELLDCRIAPNHVVAVVRVWPNHSAAQVVTRLQGAGTAARRRKRSAFPPGRLWGRGYAVTTELENLDGLVEQLLSGTQRAAANEEGELGP